MELLLLFSPPTPSPYTVYRSDRPVPVPHHLARQCTTMYENDYAEELSADVFLGLTLYWHVPDTKYSVCKMMSLFAPGAVDKAAVWSCSSVWPTCNSLAVFSGRILFRVHCKCKATFSLGRTLHHVKWQFTWPPAIDFFQVLHFRKQIWIILIIESSPNSDPSIKTTPFVQGGRVWATHLHSSCLHTGMLAWSNRFN